MIVELNQEEKEEILKNLIIFLKQDKFIVHEDTQNREKYIPYNIKL